MFDEITCGHPLPKTGYKLPEGHDGWRTKDLENLLDRYTITADGRLVLHRVRRELAPEEERPYYGTPEWDRPWGKLAGSLRSVPVGDEEVPHHGDVRFYGAFRIEGGEGRVWVEFGARFTEGRLSRIEVEDVRELSPRPGKEPEVERDEGFAP